MKHVKINVPVKTGRSTNRAIDDNVSTSHRNYSYQS